VCLHLSLVPSGWKNSLKGVGYFIGAACLAVNDDWGYEFALTVLVGIILLAYPWAFFGLDAVSRNPTHPIPSNLRSACYSCLRVDRLALGLPIVALNPLITYVYTVYSQCLPSYCSHVQYILSVCHPIVHTYSIFSVPAILLVARTVYSQCLPSYWFAESRHCKVEERHHEVHLAHQKP
jgi:hypothetical protein